MNRPRTALPTNERPANRLPNQITGTQRRPLTYTVIYRQEGAVFLRGFRRRCGGFGRRYGGICLISVGLGVLLALTLPLRAVLILSGLAMIVLGVSCLGR